MFELKYAKRESIRLLAQVYSDDGSPRLQRKFEVWRSFRQTALAGGFRYRRASTAIRDVRWLDEAAPASKIKESPE
jgi:hypothetical protein